jgi:ankyrin repeat protein
MLLERGLTWLADGVKLWDSAKGASSPRKGPCPPSVFEQGYEPSFSLIRADSRRIYERKVVMDAKPLPARPSLEQYKKQAKELVKLFRALQSGKSPDSEETHSEETHSEVIPSEVKRSETIQRVKTYHPRFSDLPDDEIMRRKFALANAQFVIAREHGFESWPKFAKHVEALASASFAASLSDPVTAFIVAACVPRDAMHSSGTLERAEAILAGYPAVASAGIYTAAILGEAAAVRRFLAIETRNAIANGGPYGWDALTHLCFSRYLRLDRARSDGFVVAAKALLDAGASANTGWMETNNEPHPEWQSAIYGAAGIAQHAGVTRLLLERGADPNDGETPYHVVETYDNTVMKILVESGKLNDASMTTLLLRKTDWHDYEGIKWLLQHGADPNRATQWGRTAFHHAVMRDNSSDIVEVLLEHGADPTLFAERPDTWQQAGSAMSGLAMAARRGRGDVLELIERRGIPIELQGVERLIDACARNDSAKVRSSAAQEPELVHELVAQGGKLLAEFAGVGNTGGVRQLLDLGIDVNAVTEDGDPYLDVAKNSTALHSAAWRARPAAVKPLIERGALVNALDGKGRTALALAVRAYVDSYWKERRTPESVEALLKAGASVRGVEYPSGYAEVDELLRAHGAGALE